MSIRGYVVTDAKTEVDYLVAAKTRQSAIRYVAKSVLRQLSAKPATPRQTFWLGKEGNVVLGEPFDLAALGIGA